MKVRGIETVATYDSSTGEFIINTPCESAQKYWIGGAAKVSFSPFFSLFFFFFGNLGSFPFLYLLPWCGSHPSMPEYVLTIEHSFQHANHTVIFAQLHIEGKNQGVHAFAARIRDADGNVCPNIRVADCGHKIGLNGIDNGRIW